MKVGDLVCYNGAGQKKHTIGLVLELHEDDGKASYYSRRAILIQWGCVGNGILPRTSMGQIFVRGQEIGPGDIVWHEWGDWFEVIK